MSNSIKVSLAVIAALVIGFFGAKISQPILGGDFAGGVIPSQLFSASAANNSVTPVLSNLYVNGGISAGGVSAGNQITAIYTGVAVYPLAALSVPSGASPSSSATTTQVSFTAPGFAIGDPCEVEYTGSTSTLFVSASVSAVNGNAVTSTVTILNTTGASVSLTVTSTVTGVSSTVKTTCVHTGV